jgi:hypothetical protein
MRALHSSAQHLIGEADPALLAEDTLLIVFLSRERCSPQDAAVSLLFALFGAAQAPRAAEANCASGIRSAGGAGKLAGRRLSDLGPRQLFQQQPRVHRFVQQPHMRVSGLAQAVG